jgi:hypothetical protein
VNRSPQRRPSLANHDPTLGSFLHLAEDGGLPPTGHGALDGMTVAVKDLASGDQTTVAEADLASHLRALLEP